MKKNFKTAALALAMLATGATGCQKENCQDNLPHAVQPCTSRTVCYSVDGHTNTVTVNGDDGWHEFLGYLMSLAEAGHEVTFWDSGRTVTAGCAKEKVTYITKNRNDAFEWLDEMYNQGYQVSFTYNEATGEYICVAIK